LEDICQEPGWRFDRGGQAKGKVAKPPAESDSGVFGTLWSSVKEAAQSVASGLEFAWSFTKGFWEGVKQQVSDLANLITNPLEVADGLIELGKAFVTDPAGTIKLLGEMLGEEVINNIQRATMCGAWDLGKVLGENISPAVMLKVAGKLSKYAGDLSRAVRDTKKELGCASFVAGTPVLGESGPIAIQNVSVGDRVLSRNDKHWSDTAQRVTNTFNRQAPAYRQLSTEFETYLLTDEHPVWVQGKGWTEAKDLTDDDVIVTLKGDVRVRSNAAVDKPIRVYNFSVANTPSYFVGSDGLWVHNAKCNIPSRYMQFERSQLQHEFKHAKDFGVTGNPNNQTLAAFQMAIETHVSAPSTKVINGTYKGKPATHYVDPSTGLNVFRDAAGNFWGGWKLSPAQLKYVLTTGDLV
jgi:hypothetical protein